MSDEEFKNSFHLRVKDAEVLKSLNELFATGKFESMNDLLNQAVGIGLEKIYLEFGKRKALAQPLQLPEVPDSQKLDDLDHKLNQMRLLEEDIFILLNSVEGLVASVYNVQRAGVKGEAITEELIDSGHLASLPQSYQEIKDRLTERLNRRFKRGVRK